MSTLLSILVNLVPFLSLVCLNICIYRNIRRKSGLIPRSAVRQRRDIAVTTILILIVMVYAVCHSIKAFINILELFNVIQGIKLSKKQVWNLKGVAQLF